MTSLGALKDWLVAGKSADKTARHYDRADYRLRPLPKEEIHLYVKAIDNSKVARLPDGKDWAANIGVAGGVIAASVLLILLLAPGGYNLAMNKHMERLRVERSELLNELKELRAREAALTAPERLVEYAGTDYIQPTAAQVVFAPPARATVASLKKKQQQQ